MRCAEGDPSTDADDVRHNGGTYPSPRPSAPRDGLSYSIRDGRYRYHWYDLGGVFELRDGSPAPNEELYDLRTDPEERTNLLHDSVRTGEHEAIAARMKAALMARVMV